MKKILVTGGLGYIGSHTVVELQNTGFEVVIIDDLSNSSKEVLSRITSITGIKPDFEEIDLKNAPDIAQTIAVTCFGLGIACDLTGLHTLKIKETDRLIALQDELTNLGATISVTDTSLHLEKSSKINKNIAIKTYKDHRMAMAFAPLALLVPIKILNAEVVTKSYQKFWDDMQQIGIIINEL